MLSLLFSSYAAWDFSLKEWLYPQWAMSFLNEYNQQTLQKHSQRPISLKVILNLIKLTDETNHHRHFTSKKKNLFVENCRSTEFPTLSLESSQGAVR